MIWYTKAQSKLIQIDWDVQTVTAGDYTVDVRIKPEQWTHF